jgi:SDR family mycofactocin-dependent oxidoreductase
MGRVDGKVAFITGAARGQGRSHAVRLAQEGADIVAIDLCGDLETVEYPMARSEDLRETARLVEKEGQHVIAREADVRDQAALDAVAAEAVAEFGHIDIVAANAGAASYGFSWELTDEAWKELIDVMLTGAWHTVKAVTPAMIAAERGGSVIITSSVAAMVGAARIAHYAAAKAGVGGLMRVLANELAPYGIRVNVVAPGNIETDLATNDVTLRALHPNMANPTKEDVIPVLRGLHALPVGYIQPVDISNAVLWLASDEARYVTGIVVPVDAGWMIK